MQIGAAGQSRQCLVGGIADHIRTQIHGMGGSGQESQIGPVGIVHQEQNAVPMANISNCRNIRTSSQIIGGGQIHRRRCIRLGQDRLDLLFGILSLLCEGTEDSK